MPGKCSLRNSATGEGTMGVSKSLLVRLRIWSTDSYTYGSADTQLVFSWLAGMLAVKSRPPMQPLTFRSKSFSRVSSSGSHDGGPRSCNGENCKGGESRYGDVSMKVTFLLSTTRSVFVFQSR